MNTKTRKPDRLMAVIALLGCGLLVAFWGFYLTGGITLGDPGSVPAAFENAFPAADSLIAILLAVAAVWLWQGRPAGRFAMISAASMVLYLGILDLTFYSRQGMLSALQISMSLACILGGSFSLVRCGRKGAWS